MIDKSVAIIGSNGYIGRHIEHYLQQKGIVPFCYDILDIQRPNYRKIDLTDKKSVESINLNVDYIFMFSGLTGTFVGFDKYEDFIDINEKGFLYLLDAIRKSPYRPKIVFPSTRLVYKGNDTALTEEDEKAPKTIYAINKLACEGYLKIYKENFNIPYVIFRICVPYGNLLSSDYSFGTVGFFVKQAKAGRDITLYGGGRVKRTFTHMEDLCFQLVEGAFSKESTGNIYNIGGEALSLYEAAKIIASKFGVEVTSVPWPERDLQIESGHTYFDDSKIKDLLKAAPYKKLSEYSNDL